jgi:hypothetical protein
LKELDKLVALIEAKTIKLYLTQQVVDEFKRNRETNLSNSIKEFRSYLIKPCPSFMRELDEYDQYKKVLGRFSKSSIALAEKAMADAKEGTLDADKLFAKLLHSAKVLPVSDEAFSAAQKRNALGNPPGKQNSMGDELNWEILLESVSKDHDLHIVSKDRDFASPLDSTQPKAFLIDEWKEKQGGQLYLYEQIGQFFTTQFPGEDFSLEVEKQEAISKLVHSGNFATTHSAIALLLPHIPFLTAQQAEQVVQGGLSNTQVAWIISDADVEAFFMKLYEEHHEALSEEQRERLEEALNLNAQAAATAEP